MTYFLRHKDGRELRTESKLQLVKLKLKGYRLMYEIKDWGKKK